MGLLDALIRRGRREVTRMAVNAIVDELGKNSGSTQETAPASTQAQQASPVASVNTYMSVEDKLRKILAEDFAQYEVKENVSPVTLGGTGNFMPYSFGIYENGTPKLFIMVVSNNTCSQRLYRWSKEEAAKAGVTMINFVGHFENKMDYVKNRLQQYL